MHTGGLHTGTSAARLEGCIQAVECHNSRGLTSVQSAPPSIEGYIEAACKLDDSAAERYQIHPSAGRGPRLDGVARMAEDRRPEQAYCGAEADGGGDDALGAYTVLG